MLPIERQEKILRLVTDKGVVSVAELMAELAVSHMTIRRDIQRLERSHAIVSVSGGIALPERSRLLREPSHLDKTLMFSQQKAAIARLALEQIKPDSTLYLDAGTTTLALARLLLEREDLLVVTNDFVITNLLAEQGRCQLIHTGGTLCRENRSAVGHFAASMVKNLFIDVAFISASSWNLRGLSTPNENKAAVKAAVAQVSERRILLCDSSKYGRVANYLALPLTKLELIISDSGLSQDAVDALHPHPVLLADHVKQH